MVTPAVRMINRDDIIFARTWLAKYAPHAERRSWIDVEKSMRTYFPGGMKAWLYRTSNKADDYAP